MTRNILALSLAISAAAQAQSLSEFLSAADRFNTDERLSQNASDRSEIEAARAWGGLLPAVTANGGYTRNQYPAVFDMPNGPGEVRSITIVPRNQWDATLKAELPLLDPSAWLETAAAKTAAQAARHRQSDGRDQVRRAVVAGFYAYVGSSALVASTQRSLAVAESQLAEQRVRREAGTATALELLRAEAEVERNRQACADAEATFANNTRNLESLTGLTPRTVESFPADDLAASAPLEELEARVEQVPSVKASQEDQKAAEQNRLAAGLALAPAISAQFTQRFTNATSFQGVNALWNTGINFNWRLDLAGVQGYRLAENSGQAAALNLEKARLRARDQIHSDWQRLNAARAKVKAARAQVASSRQAATIAHDRYTVGVASQVDVIQADRDLLSAEVNEIQAGFELASARASLRLSAGLGLEGAP